MVEGRNLDPVKRGEEIHKILDSFGQAVAKLKQIGLTHKSAVIQAGMMYDLRLEEADVADEPPPSNGDRSTLKSVA